MHSPHLLHPTVIVNNIKNNVAVAKIQKRSKPLKHQFIKNTILTFKRLAIAMPPFV
jgi:hypothetical protein